MNKNLKCEHKDRIRLDLVAGNPNWCLTLGENGGVRITNGKLWGMGRTVHSIAISRDRLSCLIEGKETVTFRFIDYGNKGVYLDDVKISANGKKSDYDAYIQKKEEQKKLLKRCWSMKRYRTMYDDTWFVVKTENIKRFMKMSMN